MVVQVFDQVWDLGQCMTALGSGLVRASYRQDRQEKQDHRRQMGLQMRVRLVLGRDDNLE